MSIARHTLRWDGWGRLGETMELSPGRRDAILEELGRRLGRTLSRATGSPSLEEIELPEPRLPDAVLARLRTACGDDRVRTSRSERVTHATGKSFPDLLRLRRGDFPHLPDAVVYPADEGAVAALLRVAADADLAVVPFGGGTSVVGGVEPRHAEGQRGVISLDTTHLDQLIRIDEVSRLATLQAGIDGPALEAVLREHGFTLGHFPQSFEHSTLGGWIAARSSGQLSSRYGGIDDLLVAVRVVTPEGVLRTLEVPRSAAGPDVNALVLGSEGTLGVIVEATLRVTPAPAASDFRGMLFKSFSDGVTVIREAVQEELPVAMLRLSDPGETELFQVLRRDPSRRVDPAALVLSGARSLGYGEGRCAMIFGAEGTDGPEVRGALRGVRRLARRRGGLPLGSAPGRSWQRDRFRTPYLRDWLLDYDVAVDTLETAMPWSRVEHTHEAILLALGAALDSHAGGGLAMAHLSHSYVDGACLYFTFLYAVDSSHPLKQWGSIKRHVTNAVVAEGATLSHHHGVGVDHAPWLAGEKGAVGVEALRALKSSLDPKGLMNPGKLL